jgi:7,8-dihydroneopterin aldolase/epimerase/oxygenase
VSDRIILDAMVFSGTHGVYEEEQQNPQPFEVDVELALNLQPAGLSDDLTQTIDYAKVFDTCRQIVESTRFNLVEALAEAIAHELLAGFAADEVTIRIRKPQVRLGGTIHGAGIEIRRRRTAAIRPEMPRAEKPQRPPQPAP